MRNNLAKLHELLDADPNGLVSVLRAEGGWNVLLRVPSVIDENELVLRLIDEHKLTGQPGYFFDMTSNGYLAVSCYPNRTNSSVASAPCSIPSPLCCDRPVFAGTTPVLHVQ